MPRNKKQTNRKRVTLISRESNDPPLDFVLLAGELRSRGIEVTVLSRLLRKKISLSQIGYLGHMAKQVRAMNASDVVVVDTYCIPVSMLPHRKGLKVIQMWHALSAVKKFGWQTVGMEDGASEKVAKTMRMHKGYDYVLCASDATAEYFCEAFDVEKTKIVKLGLPRIDYILKEDADKVREIRSVYGELDYSKKTILYAPTFHKGEAVDVRGLADATDFSRYNMIVKLHPLDKETPEINRPGIVFDRRFDSYDLLKAADIVISDYSSLVVEASLLDKPLYLYVYDEEEYSETTGLNMKFEEEPISGYVFRQADALAAAMDEEYDFAALHEFRNKYIDVNTDNCTAQLADYIESLMEKN